MLQFGQLEYRGRQAGRPSPLRDTCAAAARTSARIEWCPDERTLFSPTAHVCVASGSANGDHHVPLL